MRSHRGDGGRIPTRKRWTPGQLDPSVCVSYHAAGQKFRRAEEDHEYGGDECIGAGAIRRDSRDARRRRCRWTALDGCGGDQCRCLGIGAVGGKPIGEKLNAGLFAPRPPERANAQIEEDGNHQGRDPEGTLIGPVRPAQVSAPDQRRKDHSRQQKEYAGNLEPQDSSDTAERTQKPAQALSQPPAGSPGIFERPLRGHGPSVPGAAPGHRGRLHNCLIRDCLCSGSQPLASDAPSDPKADAERPADGLRSHPIYDGSSPSSLPFFPPGAAGCCGTRLEVR